MRIVFMLLLSITFITSAMADVITTDIVGGCTNDVIDYFYPVFEINSYTCETGTFLPAGSTRCVPCPVDHNCSEGTYIFNETSPQGIVFNYFTQDANNSCGDTLTGSFVSIFEPKEVNIGWSDDNGDIGEISCTYDSNIVLPPEPTRAVYTFNGWKLEKTEQKDTR